MRQKQNRLNILISGNPFSGTASDSTEFKAAGRDFFAPAGVNRRELLEAGIRLAVAASGLEMIAGCTVAKTTPGRKMTEKEKGVVDMNTGRKADYVLVHGGNMSTDAWNMLTGRNDYPPGGRLGGKVWDSIIPALKSFGHRVFAPTLLDEHSCHLTDHVGRICALIVENDLRDVILVGHSYGGMIITGTAAGMADRISHLVYVDAALPAPGQSLFDIIAIGGCDPMSFAGLEPAAPYVEKLQFDAQKIKMLPKTYILGTKSEFAAVTRVAKQKIAHEKKEWTYIELPSSHVPMADMPDEFAQLLLETAKKGKE